MENAASQAAGWEGVERRWSPDNRNLKCPCCKEWKDSLLLKDDGDLCCWRCLQAERKARKDDGNQA